MSVAYVIGPEGEPLTLADLPRPGVRWTVRRKAAVVAAVRGGLLSLGDALVQYDLSAAEFNRWSRLLSEHGLEGLRATKYF